LGVAACNLDVKGGPTFKIYLLADDKLRAKRIQGREGGNLEDIAAFTRMRDREDSSRYLKLYKIDNNKFDFVDMKVDTTCNIPEQIVQGILDELVRRGLIIKE
jgi:cytidylate kinase